MKTVYKEPIVIEFVRYLQGDHLSGTPGNVREFDSCQGNVRNLQKVMEMSRKKSCRGKVA